ncbi:MAG: hypothetical protein AAF851_13350 [Myxococcota bacterium]
MRLHEGGRVETAVRETRLPLFAVEFGQLVLDGGEFSEVVSVVRWLAGADGFPRVLPIPPDGIELRADANGELEILSFPAVPIGDQEL